MILLGILLSVATVGGRPAAEQVGPTPDPQPAVFTGRGGEASGENRVREAGENPEAVLAMIDNPRIGESLGLSEEQRTVLKEATARHRGEMARLRGELEVAATDQAKLVSAAKPDTKAIMSAVEKAGRIRTEMAKQAMRNFLNVREKLSPEQRSKLKDIVRRLHDRRRQELKARSQPEPCGQESPAAGNTAANSAK